MSDTVKFIFGNKGEVTMDTHAESNKCAALGKNIRDLLANRFAMGDVTEVSSNTVKEDKVIAQVNQG